MNLLEDIVAGLRDLRQATGFAVTYTYNGNVLTGILATIGNTPTQEVISDDGATVRGVNRDYLIAVSDLTHGGIPVIPLDGHTITEADGTVFEVRPLGGERCWRWVDAATRQHYRIHTQQVTNL